jgi:hypothetical protein
VLEAELVEELTDAGVELDPDVAAAVRWLLKMITEIGSDDSGKYTVDVRGGKGVQVGDGNVRGRCW